jgi:glycerol-3-phosphate acyltransferase PlsX
MSMVREEVMRSGLFAKVGAALMTGALRRLRRRTDYAEHGGAPLLGIDGVALICHGGSNAKAMQNAVYVADRFAQLGLGKELTAAVARHASLWDVTAAAAPAVEAIP